MATKDACAKIFQPLDAGRSRLAEIYRGTWNQPIVCKLCSNVDISLCRYETLSYCCRDPRASPHLISVNGYNYLVLPSLFTALRRLRHPEASRVARMAAGGRYGLAQSLFQVGGNMGSASGPLLAAFIVVPYSSTSVR